MPSWGPHAARGCLKRRLRRPGRRRAPAPGSQCQITDRRVVAAPGSPPTAGGKLQAACGHPAMPRLPVPRRPAVIRVTWRPDRRLRGQFLEAGHDRLVTRRVASYPATSPGPGGATACSGSAESAGAPYNAPHRGPGPGDTLGGGARPPGSPGRRGPAPGTRPGPSRRPGPFQAAAWAATSAPPATGCARRQRRDAVLQASTRPSRGGGDHPRRPGRWPGRPGRRMAGLRRSPVPSRVSRAIRAQSAVARQPAQFPADLSVPPAGRVLRLIVGEDRGGRRARRPRDGRGQVHPGRAAGSVAGRRRVEHGDGRVGQVFAYTPLAIS